MTSFVQREFNDFVIENNVIGFHCEPVKLKSGRVSSWYVNWRSITDDVYLTDKLSEYLIDFIDDRGIHPRCIYGVPEGATKLGVITQYKIASRSEDYEPRSHVLAMGRGKPKEHGEPRDRFFLGQPTGDTVVIEDVATTGDSLLKEMARLRETGTEVIAAIVLTDRMEKRDDGSHISDALTDIGMRYFSLSSALDLLPVAVKKIKPAPEILDAIEREFLEYGAGELELK